MAEEYETKVAVAEQTPPAPAADTPKIYPSRGIFKVLFNRFNILNP